jgi:DNA-binding CsgD family transcriptional regulator
MPMPYYIRIASSFLRPIEIEVLKLVIQGSSIKDSAGILGISMKKTKNHTSSILRKLKAENHRWRIEQEISKYQ